MTAGHVHANADDLMRSVDAAIRQIPRADWQAAMDWYAPRLRRCIAAGGRYFERC